MPLPTFLCIGAVKAGTSWLYQNLSQHNGIWLPPIKELQYFNHLFVEADRKWTAHSIEAAVHKAIVRHARNHADGRVDFRYVRYLSNIAVREVFSEAWYRRIFDWQGAKGKVTGEITPGYAQLPSEGIAAVKGLLGDVKLLYIVRDPVDRTLSHLRMRVSRSHQPKDMEEWQRWASAPEVESRSDYKQCISRWREAFAPEKILFLPYGDIATDALGFLRRVETFLGVDPFDKYDWAGVRVHQTQIIEIPEEIKDFIARRMELQIQFLKDAFGTNFAARTKAPAKQL
jgi:hypothetical protein